MGPPWDEEGPQGTRWELRRPGAQTVASMEAQQRGRAEWESGKAAGVPGTQGTWGDAERQTGG